MATKKNTKKLTSPVIKYFYHQGPKVVRVLRKMMFSYFDHLGITTCKFIDQGCMFIDQVLKGLDRNKYRNAVLTWKELVRNESGDHWGLGKPEDVCSYYFWTFCNTNGLGRNSDKITAKDRCIYLDISLWFMVVRSMWKKHHNVFDEQIYYVRIDTQKLFNIGILE